jgi:nitrate/nitrite transport system substrate-binding protein
MILKSNSNLLKNQCPECGGFHRASSHFLPDLPQEPVELINDLLKMGVYSDKTLSLARDFSNQNLREALLVKNIANGDVEKEKICLELVRQAGGIDAAFGAAFGHKSDEFFRDTIRASRFSRRQFLKQVGAVATLIALANCSQPETEEKFDFNSPLRLEKNQLKIGFLPITCAAPILTSKYLGFYEKYGLEVELVKVNSWSEVRDGAIAGELDAYHMLSPMPLAITLGLGSRPYPIKLACIQNLNGNAITVAMKHKGKVNKPEDFKGFTIGIPFAYSMHNLLLRYYLAAGNLNPDKDVKLITLSPVEMVSQLVRGNIDAFIVAEPFNQIAVRRKAGFIHLLTRDLWPAHPCCSFTASKNWIDENPNTFRALNKAIIEASSYASNMGNRRQIAREISAPEYVDAPVEILEAVLTGVFEDGLGNLRDVFDFIDFDPYPWKSFSYWITTQLVRWNFTPENLEHEEIADEVFMTGIARQLAKQLGQNPPTLILDYERLKYDLLDPTEPNNYLKEQIKKYGF